MKQLYLGGSDSGLNKIVLATKIETHVGKRQLLADYLSTVPSGANLYGMQAAACEYFGLPLSQLNLGQDAMLAGMPQAPSAYDPLLHPVAASWRRSEVLASMVGEGYITGDAAATASAEPPAAKASQVSPVCR